MYDLKSDGIHSMWRIVESSSSSSSGSGIEKCEFMNALISMNRARESLFNPQHHTDIKSQIVI